MHSTAKQNILITTMAREISNVKQRLEAVLARMTIAAKYCAEEDAEIGAEDEAAVDKTVASLNEVTSMLAAQRQRPHQSDICPGGRALPDGFPISELEQFENFTAARDVEKYKELVGWMSQCEGLDPKTAVRNMFGSTIKGELRNQLSWKTNVRCSLFAKACRMALNIRIKNNYFKGITTELDDSNFKVAVMAAIKAIKAYYQRSKHPRAPAANADNIDNVDEIFEEMPDDLIN